MSCRVAIVEDDNDLRVLLEYSLRQHGCEVAESFNNTVAACAWDGWSNIDVVVADWHISEHEFGSDLLGWLRRQHPEVGRILVTAWPRRDVPIEEAESAHIFVSKPFEVGFLIHQIRRLARHEHV